MFHFPRQRNDTVRTHTLRYTYTLSIITCVYETGLRMRPLFVPFLTFSPSISSVSQTLLHNYFPINNIDELPVLNLLNIERLSMEREFERSSKYVVTRSYQICYLQNFQLVEHRSNADKIKFTVTCEVLI